MTRLWMILFALAVFAPPPSVRAQQPDSSGVEDPDVQALRRQIRQRWHEHVRQTLGLSDEQAGKVQATEDRFEQQRVQYRGHLRDINRQLNGEMLSGTPNNERVNQLIQQRQETRMRLEQLNRDEDTEMAGYLSPPQRVRYQQERARFQERIAEFVRHRREQGGGGGGRLGPRRGGGGAGPGAPAPRGGQGGRPGRKPRP